MGIKTFEKECTRVYDSCGMEHYPLKGRKSSSATMYFSWSRRV